MVIPYPACSAGLRFTPISFGKVFSISCIKSIIPRSYFQAMFLKGGDGIEYIK
ncbi:hypothetical protein XNA1_4400008 [Xenorhabdus nematophila str. Anatoliense]|nr:hypothetical protein XNA1_4400008 [Xenorhabdus nematophila str. Anatoliense]